MGIGTVLLERGLITPEQLDLAIEEQRRTGERLDRVLVRLGFVDNDSVLTSLGEQFSMPVVDLSVVDVTAEVLAQLPAKLVYRQNCVPIARDNGTLVIATSDPFELTALDELRLLTGCAIELVLADEEELRRFIRAHYGVGGDTLDQMSAGLDQQRANAPRADELESEIEQAQEASVVRLVNDILTEAVTERATDIHIEPYEHELVVRYRIDGVLLRAAVPASINRFAAAIISRIKIMASLNIAEKRKPQDGRITFISRAAGRRAEEFDLRVSVIPMMFGEGVVLRVLSKTAVLMSLGDLGMPAILEHRWRGMIDRPHGIVLVTGPTGSGKSTTLYASLNQIVSDEVKVITVEDPVEYNVPGVNQIAVNHRVGLGFAEGLRAILRHDPDAVMIGEIRDRETAETAVQASLTGHIVFSTLHTNDSAGAVTRLLDMGVEPFLVASSVEGVLAQRLVRRICRQSYEHYTPAHGELPPDFIPPSADDDPAQFGPNGPEVIAHPGQLRRGIPARENRMTGFRGRVGLYELLTVSNETREMIMARVNAPRIAAEALKAGDLFPMKRDGYDKVRAGVTTISEVMQALQA